MHLYAALPFRRGLLACKLNSHNRLALQVGESIWFSSLHQMYMTK